MLRFAANLNMMYTEFPLLERFAAAARDGFTAVECLFPYQHSAVELGAQLKEQRLQLILINAPPGDWAAGERGLAALPGREVEFRSAICTAIEYAHALECARVHVMAGLQPAGVERAAMRETFVNNLRWAVGVASGIQLLIEPINPRDMPGYFLNRQDEAHAIVDEIGNPALRVQMDLYHCQIVEGDVSAKLRKYLRRVGHVQIAGVPDRHEPDHGELDYSYVLDLIDELGYRGWIGCEYLPKNGTSEGLGWLRERD
jgi:2-dehydrotetronate isomerase